MGGVEFGLKVILLFIESGDIRALEGIDRLFFIADDEQSTGFIAGSKPGGKFGGQEFDDAPLIGAGVLRFVDKDMVDAAVKTEQHPCGDGGVGQQGLGAGDQIVEIEEASGRFGGLIKRQEGGGKAVQDGGLLGGLQGDAAGAGGFNAEHQGVELRQVVADQFLRGLGGQRADFCTVRGLGGATVEQGVLKRAKGGEAGGGQVERREFGGGFAVGGAAVLQGGQDVSDEVGFNAEQHVGEQGLRGFRVGDIEQIAGLRFAQRFGEACAFG